MPRPKSKKADRYLEFPPTGSIGFRITLPGPHGTITHRATIGHVDIHTARRVRDALIQTIDGARACAAVGIEPPPNPFRPTGTGPDAYGLETLLAKLNILRRRTQTATIGDLISALESDAIGREVKERSIYCAGAALRNILRTVHPDREPDEHSIHILTARLLDDYKAAKIAAAKNLGPDKRASNQRTIASTVRQAQSVVCDDAQRQPAMRALQLPALTDFRTWRSGYTTRKIRTELDDTTIERLRHTIEDLWFDDPAAWLALSLAGNLGLRRGETTMARWSWVRMIGGAPVIYLLKTDEASPKGNERKLAIPPDLWADMCAHRTTSDYILPGTDRADRDAILDRTCKILRTLGLEVGKPNHELRALQMQAADRAGGRDNAQLVGGHGDRRTTETYTGRGTGQTIRVL